MKYLGIIMAVLSLAPLHFISSIPPATRGITAATVFLSLLYYFLEWTGDERFSAPYLVLVPGSSLFYPWTFLMSAFVETTIIEVCRVYLPTGDISHPCPACVHSPRHSCLVAILGATMGHG